MDVLHHERHGLLRRGMLEEPPDRPRELLHREGLWSQTDHRGEAFRDALARRVRERRELRERRLGTVVVHDPACRLERLCERPERDAVAVREAASLEGERTVGDPIEELGHQPRLPDACVRYEGHETRG